MPAITTTARLPHKWPQPFHCPSDAAMQVRFALETVFEGVHGAGEPGGVVGDSSGAAIRIADQARAPLGMHARVVVMTLLVVPAMSVGVQQS